MYTVLIHKFITRTRARGGLLLKERSGWALLRVLFHQSLPAPGPAREDDASEEKAKVKSEDEREREREREIGGSHLLMATWHNFVVRYQYRPTRR